MNVFVEVSKNVVQSPLSKKIVVAVAVTITGYFAKKFTETAYDATFDTTPTKDDD